ncbi:hypothetical protein ACFL2Z_00465 [Candidatus Eisenbacteria bacterium]|uniref:DUF11 domain-containing protein n=1 Tax=Eiseniibacteriota bacterium TaxID=2212470 RepID=A0ABV6YMS9_UNCEI
MRQKAPVLSLSLLALGLWLLALAPVTSIAYGAPDTAWSVQSGQADCYGPAEQGIAGCDDYASDVYEAIDYVNPPAEYAATSDIVYVRGGFDTGYFYIEYEFMGDYDTDASPGHQIVVEIEVDPTAESHRGDYSVVVYQKSEFNYATWIDAYLDGGYEIFQDSNNDVGGASPLASDYGGTQGDGYETSLTQGADDVWCRVVGGNFQLAVNKSAIGNPTNIHVRAWSRQSAGLSGDSLYFHDQKDVGDVFQIDNTCGLGTYDWMGLGEVSTVSGTVYHDINANGFFDAGELGIGRGWVKLISGGYAVAVAEPDPDSGVYSFASVSDGNYILIIDDNDLLSDTTPTEPANWLFWNPADGTLNATVAGSDVGSQDLGLVFDYDASTDCLCGYDNGMYTERSITVDGDMSDWGPVVTDMDNNACDGAGTDDLDYPVQSTGRNLIHAAACYDDTYFSMYTRRVGSSKNTQTFVYYSDTNNDGLMEYGETVIVAQWKGNKGTVTLAIYGYDDLGTGPHPLLDEYGYSDGYSMPGDLFLVQTLPDESGIGSTVGDGAGVEMEWTILWSDMGLSAGSALRWHISSTNANPGSAGLGAQIDDNLGGCGGACAGSNQFGDVEPEPESIIPGSFSYLFHRIINTGNGFDAFDLESTDTGDFGIVSYAYHVDLGVAGVYEAGTDTLLTDTTGSGVLDTGSLAGGDTIHVIVVVELPPPPISGTVYVTTTSTSNYLPGCGGTTEPAYGYITDILTFILPDLAVVKTLDLVSDPVNGTTNPKAIPGASLDYLIQVTNTGEGVVDSNTVAIADSIPQDAKLYVGDLGVPGSGPIEFLDGATPSGLTYTFLGLGSPADDVTFFDSAGEFTPSPDGDGYDAAVVSIRVNPKGQFDAASGGNNPSLTLRFRTRVK